MAWTSEQILMVSIDELLSIDSASRMIPHADGVMHVHKFALMPREQWDHLVH
jgi:hypothetical protein